PDAYIHAGALREQLHASAAEPDGRDGVAVRCHIIYARPLCGGGRVRWRGELPHVHVFNPASTCKPLLRILVIATINSSDQHRSTKSTELWIRVRERFQRTRIMLIAGLPWRKERHIALPRLY